MRIPALPSRSEHLRLLELLVRPAPEAAAALLGHVLAFRDGRRERRARIVETEAYLPRGDPGAHVFRRRTLRVEPLFGPPGSIYVYFVYGMHHCLNLAVDEEGVPGCALIRAAELLDEQGRPGDDPSVCRGPARLCRALGLSVRDSGANLFTPGARLTLREGDPPPRIGRSRRIGLSVGTTRVLRFFDAKSAAVSVSR